MGAVNGSRGRQCTRAAIASSLFDAVTHGGFVHPLYQEITVSSVLVASRVGRVAGQAGLSAVLTGQNGR